MCKAPVNATKDSAKLVEQFFEELKGLRTEMERAGVKFKPLAKDPVSPRMPTAFKRWSKRRAAKRT